MAVRMAYNPVDFTNIVSALGNPPESDEFEVVTDEAVDRGFVLVTHTDGDAVHTDTVPLMILGQAEAAMTDEELAEFEGNLLTELSALFTDVLGDASIELNPAEYARAVELFGASPFEVQANDEIELGCIRVNGELNCDPTVPLEKGVLGRNDDGSLYVTSGDVSDG